MLESMLKWSSILSLCALVIILALEIAPRFVERAEAEEDPFLSQDTMTPDQEEQLPTAAAVRVREPGFSDDVEPDRSSTVRHSAPVNPYEAPHPSPDTRNNIRRYDVESEDLPERQQALRPDPARRPFDVVREDLRERHEALVQRNQIRQRRYDSQPADLQDRHEVLMDKSQTRRFDSVEADLQERHQALRVDNERNEDETVKYYYLIPVPDDESAED